MLIRNITRYFLVAAGLMFIASCSSISGVEYPIDRVAEVHVGMAEQDVKNILGEPYVIERYAEGEKWIWSYASRKLVHSFVVTLEDGYVRSLSGFKDTSY
ncbi:MAG: hypothetical protein HAW61_06105 [Candidatus Portiera sp.]|nr:hypothetical protein [Portiera sp.]